MKHNLQQIILLTISNLVKYHYNSKSSRINKKHEKISKTSITFNKMKKKKEIDAGITLHFVNKLQE